MTISEIAREHGISIVNVKVETFKFGQVKVDIAYFTVNGVTHTYSSVSEKNDYTRIY